MKFLPRNCILFIIGLQTTAYNVISAPKTLYLALETGHWTYPGQHERMNNWLIERLTGKR